jgi:hypothetical protein
LTYLERIKLPFKSYHCLLSLSSINELTKLEDLPFYPINPNSFGRKIEETPIYISMKLNFIPL